jgi:Ca-activated chloride channel homolog
MMVKRCVCSLSTAAIMLGSVAWLAASPSPQNPPTVRSSVEMVQLNVAVTDKKGKYITGLQPNDFVVNEDGIGQRIAMFAEGDNAPKTIGELKDRAGVPSGSPQGNGLVAGSFTSGNLTAAESAAGRRPEAQDGSSPLAAASVFILFDTSNYMYRGFVFAQDAIADFVRSLEGPDRVALYSYSRDLYRASRLTANRMQVLRAVRTTVAGDDAALYDAILLTLRDSTNLSGRRVIVVFSNGPDNASLAPPEDVEQLAQSEGVAIYMISTRQVEADPLSTKVFERISASTGGEAYFARNWEQEEAAFASIRHDLAHLYSLYYYPQPNPNRGWRAITVKLKLPGGRRYRIRARSGYRPLPEQVAGGPVG